MKLTQKQREKIISLFPRQHGNVVVDDDHFLDALVYLVHNGCTWRSLPAAFGPWHTIYVRINRWAKNGVLERIFQAFRDEQIGGAGLAVVCLDSTSAKVHPDAAGAEKKTARKRLGRAAEGRTRRFT